MENQLTRDELKAKLRSKINLKSASRNYPINRKKNQELQEKLSQIKNILDSNSITTIEDLSNNSNLNIVSEKINSLLSNNDLNFLKSKISNNPNLLDILSKIKEI